MLSVDSLGERKASALLACAIACAVLTSAPAEATAHALNRCESPAITAARGQAPSPVDMIERAMKGKPFVKGEDDSIAFMNSILVSQYGMKRPLSTIGGEAGRWTTKISRLVGNDYFIAAQMTYGLATQAGVMDADTKRAIGSFVMVATEPYPEDEELTQIAAKLVKAIAQIGKMPENLRPYAKWIAKGFAFDDAVAIDAALYGFCAQKQTKGDLKLLESAINISKLTQAAGRGGRAQKSERKTIK